MKTGRSSFNALLSSQRFVPFSHLVRRRRTRRRLKSHKTSMSCASAPRSLRWLVSRIARLDLSPDLSHDQFHLYENGIEQEIALFENAEKPFTVALLLDTSDSTKFKLNEIQDAAIAFVEQLRTDDRVIVAAFDRQITILAEESSDRRVLHDAIRRARTGGGTSLYNAVDVIVNQRLSHIRGRKAVVLFTDGVDTSSLAATYQGTLRAAEELDAFIYAIRYNTYDDATKDATRGLSHG